MKGQVFTIAKLHYVNGVVYHTAKVGSTDLATLALHSSETTKSGNVKHPLTRVRTLVRFAEGLSLLNRPDRDNVHITNLGKKYFDLRSKEKWSLSTEQKELLREHIFSDPARTPTIHSIAAIFSLVQQGFEGSDLTKQYAIAIEKEEAWRSKATYEGFTGFGLSYIEELGLSGDSAKNLLPLKVDSLNQRKLRKRIRLGHVMN